MVNIKFVFPIVSFSDLIQQPLFHSVFWRQSISLSFEFFPAGTQSYLKYRTYKKL